MPTLSRSERLLRLENSELRARLEEAQETIRAIRSGEVDALVVESPSGPKIFTLQGLDAEENRFRGEILAQVNDAVVAVDDDRRVIYLNAAAEREYGMSSSEALGRCLDELYETLWARPEDGAAAAKALKKTGHWRGENIHIKADGETVYVESSMSRLRYGDEPRGGLLSVNRDITGRKLAEEALKEAQAKIRAHAEDLEKTVEERTAKLREQTAEREQLQEELLKISEREKQLIAQELHDGLCQHFAGTAMMASLLQRRLAAREDPEADQAKAICELLNTGVHETRNLSHGLHPVSPKSDGLMESLSGLAQTVTNLFHVGCTFRCDDSVLIDDQTAATHLFRIAQEAMNNAIRHGQARHVTLTLKNTDAGVMLSIQDNGIGIPRKLPASGGMGMQSMRHRAAAIGAEICVRRAGRRGTEVLCTLPPRG